MWGDILEKDIKLIQEWPDASGGDDHGRDTSHESAHTVKQHERAAAYHTQRGDEMQKQSDIHKTASEKVGYDRAESIKQGRFQQAANKHHEAAKEHLAAAQNPKAERYANFGGKTQQGTIARIASHDAHGSEKALHEPIPDLPRYAGF